MGITYVDKAGHVHVGPTGEEYRAQQRRRMGAGAPAPPPPVEEVAEGMYRVEEDVWEPVPGMPGTSQKRYRHGTLIPEDEAIRLGLLEAKKERAIEDKKERPKPATKRTPKPRRPTTKE